MLLLLWLVTFTVAARRPRFQSFNPFLLSPVDRKYASFSEADLLQSRDQAKEMFHFAYKNYMKHAFPADELDPIHCRGRGHDHAHPENININDVLGDYSLTLVDSLGALAVIGEVDEFKKAVHLVIDNVSFDKNTTVQVFEATIRVMGSLLSTHLKVSDKTNKYGNFYMEDYNDELLKMATDLGDRLMPAFRTATGIPYTRVNLQKGVLPSEINETCTAGAGSLLLEFGLLSRLTGDEKYEAAASRVVEYLWSQREGTGLTGTLINIQTGEWTSTVAGLGAGSDSFYEYLFKVYIMFGENKYLDMYNKSMKSILKTMRRGRYRCARGLGEHPMFVNVDARDGTTANYWVDSLQASFAGLLVLSGDVEESVCAHGMHFGIWRRYGVHPERFNWHYKTVELKYYPLRPELAESTYHLYRATKNPFYLHVGREILDSLNTMTRVKCGFATVHNVEDGTTEDRMESFFLSETTQYLYLLFHPEHWVNKNEERLIFSTEGHIFPVTEFFQRKPEEIFKVRHKNKAMKVNTNKSKKPYVPHPDEALYTYTRELNNTCETGHLFKTYRPPLVEIYMEFLFEMVGMPAKWWS